MANINLGAYADLSKKSDEAFDTLMEDTLTAMVMALQEYQKRNPRDALGHNVWGAVVRFTECRYGEVLQTMGVRTDAFGKPAAEKPTA